MFVNIVDKIHELFLIYNFIKTWYTTAMNGDESEIEEVMERCRHI